MLMPPKPNRLSEVFPWALKVTEYLKEISPRAGSGVKVKRTPNGTTFSSPRNFWTPPKSFQIIDDPDDSTKILLRGGLFDVIKNGVTLKSMAISGAGDFVGTGSLPTDLAAAAGSLSPSTVYWVSLVVVGTGADLGDIARANTLDAYLTSGARPTTIYQPESFRVLARIDVDADGNKHIDTEHEGNIIVSADVSDSTDPINVADGEKMESIDFDELGRRNIHDFHKSGTLLGQDPYCWIDKDLTENREIRWRYPNTVGGVGIGTTSLSGIASGISTSESSLVWTNLQYDVISGASNYKLQGGGTENVDLSDAILYWWENNGDNTHATLADIVADANAVDDHDGRYEPAWSFVDPNPDAKSYRTTGAHWAGIFKIYDRPANFWRASSLEVDVTGKINFTAGAASTWIFTGGIDVTGAFDLEASGVLTLKGVGTTSLFSDGLIVIECAEHLTLNSLEDVTITSSAFLNLAPTGELQFNGTAGVTIANWSAKGGLIGTGITEIDFEDFKSGDKILARVS